MSSVSVFQPYVDKENTGARPKNRDGSVTGLGGKVFHSMTPSLTTPRSALRDVNQGLSSGLRQQSKDLKPQKPPSNQLFKKPDEGGLSHRKANKIHIESSKKQKSMVTPRTDSKQKVITKKPDPLPEIEQMFVFNEEDEIKPKRDLNFTGVVERLIKWRPPCLFGTRPDSDIEDDEDVGDSELHRDLFKLSDDIDDLPEPVLEPFGGDDLIELTEVPVPHIELDLPIPFLDDTIDIEPNMGTLEIWDSSTPMSLTPNSKSLPVSPDCKNTSLEN